MKHKITTAICVILLIILTIFVYQSAHTGALNRAVTASKQAAATYYREQAQAKTVANEKARLAEQCKNQTNFYNSLPATLKTKVSKPECNLQVIE